MSYNSFDNVKGKPESTQLSQKQQKIEKELPIVVPGQETPVKKGFKSSSQQKLERTAPSLKIFKFQLPVPINAPKKINLYTGCNCTKSQCLKMYCTCFADGKMCDQTCLCQCCKNKTQNPARSNAIVQVISRDPFAFSRKVDQPESIPTNCNCLKSNCLKKYCDCYRRGRKCGVDCRCRDCKNCETSQDNSSQVKKPNKKVKVQ